MTLKVEKYIAPWIGVDFDKTLAVYTEWKGVGVLGEPIMPMVNRVKQWLAEGKLVKIFTARVSHNDTPHRLGEALVSRVAIEEWCEKHLGQKLEVTCYKDFGMVSLVDDRAVQVIPNTGITIEEKYQALVNLVEQHLKADAKMDGPVYYLQNCQRFGKEFNNLTRL